MTLQPGTQPSVSNAPQADDMIQPAGCQRAFIRAERNRRDSGCTARQPRGLCRPGQYGRRLLQAAALEQPGYQAESGPWRNFHLTGAEELRYGVDSSAGATL